MIVKVIRGSIKFNDTVYAVGETVELEDSEAKAIINSGIAEKYVQVVSQDEPEKEEVEAPKEEAKVEETEAVEAEPSTDWTRKELDEYAKAHGVAEPEKLGSKAEVLKAIGGEVK